MIISAHSVSLAKAGDSLAGLPLKVQVQSLTERAWLLARELDATKAELAARREVEAELAGLALEVATENADLREVVEELSMRLLLAMAVHA
ncbi:hypothetical protein [Streptomyces huasconensis]|uniref:hypothetical protein n=1 Tax=Streptomyces huasconensis TaxID=1854574 RepID=UPI0034006E22